MISAAVMQALQTFVLHTFGISIETGMRYGFFAGIAWLLAYVFFKRRWWHRKIVQREPLSADVRREMLYSAITLVIFGAVGAITWGMKNAGWTQMYWRIGKYGWGWFFASIVITIFVHDAWFYWTHRLMHHPRLFRWFHRGHHLSTNPSPWAAYAFDPLEAVVQALIFPMAVTMMPMHPIAFVIFMTWQIVFNVVGHTGYEIWPRWLMDSWFGKFINTPTNHAMHHETFRGNYGLYFNLWDRFMGTNQARYEERFREVTSRHA
jgi:sterol desaturase/sphingolipid hydroxylase (fatty acid hydroxylase superfamily)